MTTCSALAASTRSWIASPTPSHSTSTAAAARVARNAAAKGSRARPRDGGHSRASADPEATVSRQPTWPHVQGTSPPTGRWPISPAGTVDSAHEHPVATTAMRARCRG